MKKMLFALLCVAYAGTAWGQSPTPTQPTVTVIAAQPGTLPASGPQIQPVSGGRIHAGPACGAPNCGAPACGATPMKTICVPEPAVKVHTKINYSSTCEKICLPRCGLFSFLGGSSCNTGCDQHACENSQVYQKRYLVKKVCVTECPITKCVPVTVPDCDTNGRTGILHHQPRGVATPRMETFPAQPTKR